MTNRAEAEIILANQGGLCPECGHTISPLEKYEIDHEWARGRGGPDTADNKRALHKACHDAKTYKTDNPEIAKTKRIGKKHEAFQIARATRTRTPNAKARAKARMEASRIPPITERLK